MKNYKHIAIIFSLIFIVSGCAPQGTSNLQNADVTNAPWTVEDGAKEITVEVSDMGHFYEEAAKAFEKETGVKVKLVNDNEENTPVGQLFDRITAELMAGKGADLYGGILLDFNDLGKHKRLCDMTEWASKDPEIKKNEYYMKILNSETVEGKIYAFPLAFWCNALGAPAKVPELEGQEGLTWEQFFEKTKDIKRSGVLYGLYDWEIFRFRFREKVTDYIDEKNKVQKLNTPDMIKLLKQCKEWSEQGLCIKNNVDSSQLFNEAFFKEGPCGTAAFINISYDPKVNFYNMPSDSEKKLGRRITATDFVYINSASKCKGTAWKFIKFLLSEKMQSSSENFYIPVNRKAAEKKIDEELSILKENGISFDMEKAKNDIKNSLESVDKVLSFMPTAAEKIVTGVARRYYSNEISAEEAAKEMESKVELYFKEQN